MNNILFVCIGDSNIVGDSLGPLIGTFIQKNKHIIQTNSNINVNNSLSIFFFSIIIPPTSF